MKNPSFGCLCAVSSSPFCIGATGSEAGVFSCCAWPMLRGFLVCRCDFDSPPRFSSSSQILFAADSLESLRSCSFFIGHDCSACFGLDREFERP
jgi:hypothetical protein